MPNRFQRLCPSCVSALGVVRVALSLPGYCDQCPKWSGGLAVCDTKPTGYVVAQEKGKIYANPS